MMKNLFETYGFFGLIRLFINYLFTKIFFYKSRLIRLPLDLRGKRYIDFGEKLTTGKNCRIEAYNLKKNDKIITFGNNIEINDNVHIAGGEKIKIGNNVLIASRVYISDIVHGNYIGNEQDTPLSIPKERKLSTKPVIIEENVWIGEGVCILPGVRIGSGSVIGANSVVTKDIEENSIAVGIPAKVIKIFNEKTERWQKF